MIAGLGLVTVALLGLISVLVAALLMAVVLEWWGPRNKPLTLGGIADQPVFLFQGRSLIDATPAARHFLWRRGDRGSEWETLTDLLTRNYPGLRTASAAGLEPGQYLSNTTGDDSILEVQTWDDMARITLHESSQRPSLVHPLAIGAMEDELLTLRSINRDSPQLIWKEDQSGAVCWANQAYLALADKRSSASAETVSVWPPARVFDALDRADLKGMDQPRRVKLDLPGEEAPLWFDVTTRRQGAELVHYAVDAGPVVLAETQGRKFVQTLTKTFAQLSIGLAIFDKQRRLVMFNPALLDLTGLPVGFLSGRPQIGTFLDRLRDRQMLPEPKNYKSWREQVSALENAAVAGTYCENWTLPGGQTYRVTGRPHPDGAIAFTFDDITAEVALTRHFRSELETAQNVLEAMEEAIAVFSPLGTLTMSNTAYAQVWGHSAEGMNDVSLLSEIGLWQGLTAPTPLWQTLRNTARSAAKPQSRRDTIRMTDGRPATCRCVPLSGGAMLIAFHIHQPVTVRPPDHSHHYDDTPLPQETARRA